MSGISRHLSLSFRPFCLDTQKLKILIFSLESCEKNMGEKIADGNNCCLEKRQNV